MNLNFDEPCNRVGTNCIKYDLRGEIFGNPDVIPMWVADMDFPTPEFITEAVRKRAGHPIYGYSFRPDEYFSSIVKWIENRHGWKLEKEWITYSPGIVPALNLCTLAFTDPGDSIIVQPPVYFPFFSAVENHGRKLIYNQLKLVNGRYRMDLEQLESLLVHRPKMIIISNPHNPAGRSWTEEELRQLAEFCLGNNIIMLSDEIHCDLVLPGYRHIPVASLSNETASSTITCIAPSKTFNLAGLYTSSVVISNPVLRKRYREITDAIHIEGGNIFGTVASIAAYTHGMEWLAGLLDYIDSNAALVTDYCREFIPEIKVTPLEATYLMWLDCRSLGMTSKDLHGFFINKAGVGMNDGATFGPGGEGFMRMNIGCQRSTVEKALKQIGSAISDLR
ncbi:MAG: PatB family C-S lyase [Bacteroidales bacterium]